jgi:BirA family biotin operon repressor/biotin-[acetyl-CoA-carboxylase] ligase
LNVNNSLASAPAELRNTATSLCDETGRRFDMTHILLCLLKQLGDLFAASSASDLRLADRWRPYCMLRGRRVRLAAGSQTVAGVCQGIDDQGALLLQTPAGQQRRLSGVVEEVE